MDFANTTLNRLRQGLGSDLSFRWTGAPIQGLLLRRMDILAIPFSLLWCGFAIFWESAVIRSGAPFFFRLWGVPFVLVGFFIVAGRFFVDAYARAHTAYAVGDNAVYIVRDGLVPSAMTLTANALSPLDLRRRADGSGTIIFGPPRFPYAWSMWGIGGRTAFEGIPRVDEVYRLIQESVTR
jgi:hypothetical protein